VGLLRNPLILWGVVLEVVLILAIGYTAWGNLIFGTGPISWRVWLFVLPFAFGLVALDEGRKYLVRRRLRARAVDQARISGWPALPGGGAPRCT